MSSNEIQYYSQLDQEKWVLETLGFKRDGYFVEIGAHDGVELSNTFTLEESFGWNGICVEPNPDSFEKLQQNRSCNLDSSPVFSLSNITLPFYTHEADPMLSGVALTGQVVDHDNDDQIMQAQHQLKTITLNDLLDKHGAPKTIDYISIDVEGVELHVISGFDFSYDVRCWTIELHDREEDWFAVQLVFSDRGYKIEKRKWDAFIWKEGI